MHFAKPLPNNLIKRYMGWRATGFSENKAWYKRLAEEGQHPRAMVISCCDSRVHATSIFGADSGEFFIHRNIANLVPPFETDGGLHGTSATIEYAVTALKVAHIMVLGHSNCGGVKGCIGENDLQGRHTVLDCRYWSPDPDRLCARCGTVAAIHDVLMGQRQAARGRQARDARINVCLRGLARLSAR